MIISISLYLVHLVSYVSFLYYPFLLSLHSSLHLLTN